MLRLQAAKLPATVLAYMPRLRNLNFHAKRENSCDCAAAKLLCSIKLMLPLGKHA